MTMMAKPEDLPVGAGILRLARRKAGLTQTQVAQRAAVPISMISAYERGKRQPSLETLLRLLKATGYELRMHLEPYDDHDDVLVALESQMGPEKRTSADAKQGEWRSAEIVGPLVSR